MQSRNRINDIFPILLFLVFTLSALAIVLMSVQIYQRILERSEGNYNTETAAQYLTEKFRSHDENGSIAVQQFKGHNAVLLTDNVRDEVYVTCIYAYNGYLRELYTEKSSLDGCSEESGSRILEMHDFIPRKLSDRLFEMEFIDNKGESLKTCLALRSGGGE
ncbi:MAG: DUF4860 domain-containing protein [Lachnospiraceae bacterium]|nr:DUF4860 domain-containing protein [Lachnospiraceae bacterium]